MRCTLLLMACCFFSLVLGLGVADSAEAQAYSEVDAAIDGVGLPYVFHVIAWNESGDNPYVVNPWSGACGPFQFLPSTAWSLGYTCGMLTNPWIAARAAMKLYRQAVRLYGNGLQPWGY